MKKNKKLIIANIKMNGSLSFNELYFTEIKKIHSVASLIPVALNLDFHKNNFE